MNNLTQAEEQKKKKGGRVVGGGFNVLGKWVWKEFFSDERIQNYVLHCEQQVLEEIFD